MSDSEQARAESQISGARRHSACLLVLVVAMVFVSTAHAATVQGRARVIDGDSLMLAGEEIRLHGIDAPEARQHCTVDSRDWRCGQTAVGALANLVQEADIHCSWTARDHYSRALATCYRGELNINATLVESGMALAYPPLSGPYIEEQDKARESRRGLWNSKFSPPWEWRRRKRVRDEEQQKSNEENCVVKGNVNSAGIRIYHLPGWRDYARVRINPGQGDRCFETTAAAAAAGFRPARRH